MLKKENAIRVEKYRPPGGNGGPKNQYIFQCLHCVNEIKIKASSRMKTATGLCVRCNNAQMHPSALRARRLRPYEAMWNRIKDSAKIRALNFDLSYEDFLLLTQQSACHYCESPIRFYEHGHATYNLDRKDNKIGYVYDNLVVCCNRCNKGKREIFSYDEWFGMTKYFRTRSDVG